MKISVSCDNCGKLIFRWPCRIRYNPLHFCGLKCKGQWMSKNLVKCKERIIYCQDCGKGRLIKRYETNRKYSIFCLACSQKKERNGNWKGGLTQIMWDLCPRKQSDGSVKCERRSLENCSVCKDRKTDVEKQCPECGKIFHTRKTYKFFCSIKCHARNYQRSHYKKYRHVRRAREKNAKGFFTMEQFQNLINLLNFHCPSCNKLLQQNEFTIDHITPLSKGGSNWIDNIQPLCMKCNMIKKVKDTNYLLTVGIRPEEGLLLN